MVDEEGEFGPELGSSRDTDQGERDASSIR
jgi:hypothetical protein